MAKRFKQFPSLEDLGPDTQYSLSTLLETMVRFKRENPPTTKLYHIASKCLEDIQQKD